MGKASLSLGPRNQSQGRRVWLPMCPYPPGRRLCRPPWPAPDRLSWPMASGLGRRPTLPGGVENAAWARPRALEVGQMLLCSRSWRPRPGVGRPMGCRSPTRARVYLQRCELTTACWVSINTDPTQGHSSLPSCTDEATEAPSGARDAQQLWLEAARGSHEGPEERNICIILHPESLR